MTVFLTGLNCSEGKKTEENTSAKAVTEQPLVSRSDENQLARPGNPANKTAVPQTEEKSATPAATVESKGDEKKESLKVTFVELGSVRCIPCKMMQPIMTDIEKEYTGQVKVVFHDVWTEEGRPYAEKYGIQAIPTQVFLDAEGKEYFRHTGFFPKDELVKILKQKGVK
jgi:thioredoxin 1